ncbi:cyclic-phosphate processing receiver domain-containing protein [Capnocytophaga sp.]
MNLYLDDLRPTPEGFERVYSYTDFVAYLKCKGLPDFISFDHDLGEGLSGYDCAKYLVDYCLDRQLPLPDFAVHSQNPVGKENIERLLNNFKEQQKQF